MEMPRFSVRGAFLELCCDHVLYRIGISPMLHKRAPIIRAQAVIQAVRWCVGFLLNERKTGGLRNGRASGLLVCPFPSPILQIKIKTSKINTSKIKKGDLLAATSQAEKAVLTF